MPSSPFQANKTSVPILSNEAGSDVKKLLGSAQVNVSDEDLNRLVESLKGKDINKLIAEGTAKIGAVAGPAASGSKPAVQ